jgi:hypothetical protein
MLDEETEAIKGRDNESRLGGKKLKNIAKIS